MLKAFSRISLLWLRGFVLMLWIVIVWTIGLLLMFKVNSCEGLGRLKVFIVLSLGLTYAAQDRLVDFPAFAYIYNFNMSKSASIFVERQAAVKLGKEAGLQGGELNSFVSETLAEIKAEREEQREIEREIREYEEKEKERIHKAEERGKERVHELDMAKVKSQDEDLDITGHMGPFSGLGGPQIKLPMFDEERDNFDAFVSRFENLAKNQKWHKEQWSVYLSSLLKGKALDIIHRMKEEDSMDFDKVKEALMKKFRLTQEGFRQKFRSSRPEKGEDPEQFAARINNYFERWIELTKTGNTFADLFDLMVREQFLNCCNKEMIAYLKEKECHKMTDMIKWSKTYVQAHGIQAFTCQVKIPNKRFSDTQSNFKSRQNGNQTRVSSDYTREISGRTGQSTTNRNNNGQTWKYKKGKTDSNSYERGCYVCGDLKHFARTCPKKIKVHASQALLETDSPKAEHQMNSSKRGLNSRQGQWIWMPSVPQQVHSTNINSGKTVSDQSGNSSAAGCLSVPILGSKELETELLNSTGVSVKDNNHIMGMAYDEIGAMTKHMPIVSGRLMPSNIPVSVLRDTGCTTCVIKSDLVKQEQMTNEKQAVILIDGTTRQFPVAKVSVDSPYFSGEVRALCMPNALCDLVIGNIPGAKDPSEPNHKWEPICLRNGVSGSEAPQVDHNIKSREDSDDEIEMENQQLLQISSKQEEVMMVETRAQAEQKKKVLKPLKVADSVGEVTPEDFRSAQKEDKTLENLWNKVGISDDVKNKYIFVVENGWLFRRLRDVQDALKGRATSQLVIPIKYRLSIMKTAHDGLFSRHFGINNTLSKIQAQFYWPGMAGDVARFCQSCDVCQKTIDKGRVKKVPLGRMPLIGVPFQRIAMDLVGPLNPPSERGHRYILTIIDYASRYIEAIPLKTVTSIDIAEALLTVYSRVGIPAEVLTDLGPQFVSDIMKEIARLLSIRGLVSSRYHPICNGLVEKYNGLVKKVLRRLSAEQPKQWDRYLPALLFALRELPNSSLGYSPFELLYGRNVRGPLSILRELWTNSKTDVETKSEYQYVVDLQERLEKTWKLAQDSLSTMSRKYKKHYDLTAKARKLKVNDKVLVLLPTDSNKLLVQWKGKYLVTDITHENNYVLDMNGNKKMFHINLLKKYFERSAPEVQMAGFLDVVGYCEENSEMELLDNKGEDGDIVTMPSSIQKEYVEQIKVSTDLGIKEQARITELICRYQDVFTDIPK